jgi:hypothetical protein
MANLIGTAPNQVPTNGSLGTMAFQDADNAKVTSLTGGEVPVEKSDAPIVSSGVALQTTYGSSVENTFGWLGTITSLDIDFSVSRRDGNTVVVEITGGGYNDKTIDYAVMKYSATGETVIRNNNNGVVMGSLTIVNDGNYGETDFRLSITSGFPTHGVLNVKVISGPNGAVVTKAPYITYS